MNKIKLLGDLESEIMEIIWKKGAVSVRSVLGFIEKKRKIAYTTVMTVMTRLYEKGVLKRKKDPSGAFVYFSVEDKQGFVKKASAKVIKNFLHEYGDVAVAQFLDAIESADSKNSIEWKNKLRELAQK